MVKRLSPCISIPLRFLCEHFLTELHGSGIHEEGRKHLNMIGGLTSQGRGPVWLEGL
jgi:hypothetical protein